MITSIVFSKNRACQLDLLLQSIEENCPFLGEDLRIIYTATTTDFEKGYDKLIERFPNYIWDEQSHFKKDTIFAISQANKYVCFFVDDNIVYRKQELDDYFINTIFDELNVCCFSLRLGLNTTVQDFYNKIPTMFPQDLKVGKLDDSGVLFWNWNTVKEFGNFGYPFSVDGHIYKKEDLLPLLNYEFDTPNAFEGRFDRSWFKKQNMSCLTESVVVNNPLNLVGSSNNNAGKFHGQTLEELNLKFLENHRVSLHDIMQEKIYTCHQEIPLSFRRIK